MNEPSWWDKLRAWFRANPPPADWLTSGPAEDEHPLVAGSEVVKANWGSGTPVGIQRWSNGFWRRAERVDAHPGRVGAVIVPRTVVVHTTDCLPGTADAIVKSWSTTVGKGNGAHFVIRRDGTAIQLVPVTRNGQHAGGPTHGWYSVAANPASPVHPNAWAVGIEIDCAGRLRRPTEEGGDPVHADTGHPIPRSRCAQHADGTWWHKVTGEQYATLRALLDDLVGDVLQPAPAHSVIPSGAAPGKYTSRTYASNGVPWASHPGPVVGHVTLDPINKTDPGPFVMRALADWGH
jgi:N-acetyl-anhydromuramyl-L-alanine amidase AmpD